MYNEPCIEPGGVQLVKWSRNHGITIDAWSPTPLLCDLITLTSDQAGRPVVRWGHDAVLLPRGLVASSWTHHMSRCCKKKKPKKTTMSSTRSIVHSCPTDWSIRAFCSPVLVYCWLLLAYRINFLYVTGILQNF